MRVCIVGAGAIGSVLGARLALGGEEVTFIARGENLAAINARGVRVAYGDGREEIARDVCATDSFDKAGRFDLVILTLKAHQVWATRATPAISRGSSSRRSRASGSVPTATTG